VARVPRALEGGRRIRWGTHREGGLPQRGAQSVDGVHDADPPDVPLEELLEELLDEPLAEDGLADAGVADEADGADSDFPAAPASVFAASAR
jgi:hypothetical protein